MESVQMNKIAYGRATYTRVIDTQFSELVTQATASQQPTQMSVEEFFDQYDALFFQIPAMGTVNSHQYIVKKSSEYLGGSVTSDVEQAYIDEINSLRQQLLEANANYLNLNQII